jgi:hypothetical protein
MFVAPGNVKLARLQLAGLDRQHHRLAAHLHELGSRSGVSGRSVRHLHKHEGRQGPPLVLSCQPMETVAVSR